MRRVLLTSLGREYSTRRLVSGPLTGSGSVTNIGGYGFHKIYVGDFLSDCVSLNDDTHIL